MMKKPKVVATIEARMASSRLPGKVMIDILGRPVIGHIIDRIKRASLIDEIVLATTTNSTDDVLADFVKGEGIKVFRGSENDVLSRVLGAAKMGGGEILVELLGECLLLDEKIIDDPIQFFLDHLEKGDIDYIANNLEKGIPEGIPVQVFPVGKLAEIDQLTNDPADREHVSLYFYEVPGRYRIKQCSIPSWLNHPEWRWALDYPEDLEFMRTIFSELYHDDKCFSSKKVSELLLAKPEILSINQHKQQKKVR